MNKVKNVFLPIVQGFVLCAIILQVILGIGYICINFMTVPKYQDTVIYLQMAEQFVADEYTGLLYPFWVKLCCSIPYIPYQVPIYLLQIIVGLWSVYNFVFSWTKSKVSAMLCAVWMNTIPFIAQAHVTVLPHSFAMSCMVYMLSQVMQGCANKRTLTFSQWFRLLWGYVVLAQLTRGYLAVGTLLVVWAALLQFYRNRHRGVLFAVSLLICAGIFAMNLSVYHMTELDGYYGKMPKTISSVLFQRMGMPSFTGKYQLYMPEEMQTDFSEADIDSMQRYPYKLETELNPILMQKYGKERTNQIYWDLAVLGMNVAGKQNLLACAEDGVSYLLPIGMYYTWQDGEQHGITNWNYQQFISEDPKWSHVYITISHMMWILGLGISMAGWLIAAILRRKPAFYIGLPVLAYLICYAGIMTLRGMYAYDYKLALFPVFVLSLPMCSLSIRCIWNKD